MTALLAYIPVLHQGYVRLFAEYFSKLGSVENSGQKSTHPENATTKVLYLIPPKIASEFGPIHKDLHALEPDLITKSVESWQLFDHVEIIDLEILKKINQQKAQLHIPDEVISKEVVKKYLPNCPTTTSSIFLRWDKENATKPHQPTADQISSEEFSKLMLAAAKNEGALSSDWWRQVGAVAVRQAQDRSSEIIAQAHNTHLPSEQQPYIEGDGRAQFHKGEHIEATTAIHAEAKIVAEAAKSGISLSGADLYVTDFPCPPCAKLVAAAGFKRVFYEKGYAVFDGERVLESAEVKIIKVSD